MPLLARQGRGEDGARSAGHPYAIFECDLGVREGAPEAPLDVLVLRLGRRVFVAAAGAEAGLSAGLHRWRSRAGR